MRRVVAALVVVLAAGCSSDPAPKEPEPRPTPTITAPAMPAQAKENTPEGASAFVDYYVQVLNYAAATGDVDQLSQLSSPECEGCQSYIKLYRDTYKAGGYFKGGEWTHGDFKLEFADTDTYATTTVDSGGGRYRLKGGDPEKSSARDQIAVTFALNGTGSDRRITQIALEKDR